MATRTWITTTWTSSEKARPCAASTSSLVRQTLADVDWICPSEIYFLLNIILTLYFYRRRRRRRRGRGRRWRHRGWRGDPPWVRGQRRHGRLSRCLFDLTADKLHPQHREELCLDLAAGSNNTLSWRKGGDRGMLGQFWMVSLRLEKSEIYLDLCRRGKKKLRRRGVGFCPILYLLMWLFVSFSHGLVSFFFFCFCFYRDIFCLCFVVVVFFNQKLLLVTPRFLKVTILFFLNVPDLFQLLAQTTSLEQSSTRASGFPPRRIHLWLIPYIYMIISVKNLSLWHFHFFITLNGLMYLWQYMQIYFPTMDTGWVLHCYCIIYNVSLKSALYKEAIVFFHKNVAFRRKSEWRSSPFCSFA